MASEALNQPGRGRSSDQAELRGKIHSRLKRGGSFLSSDKYTAIKDGEGIR